MFFPPSNANPSAGPVMTLESWPVLVFICTGCQRKCFFCPAHLIIYLLNKASFWPEPGHCENVLLFLRISEVCGSQIPLPCMAKGSRREADLIGRSGTGRCGEKPEKPNKLPFSPKRNRSNTHGVLHRLQQLNQVHLL